MAEGTRELKPRLGSTCHLAQDCSWRKRTPFPHRHMVYSRGPQPPGCGPVPANQISGGIRLRNKAHNKCSALESSDIQPSPPHPTPWKNCLPLNWFLVPKGWGPTESTRESQVNSLTEAALHVPSLLEQLTGMYPEEWRHVTHLEEADFPP